MAKENEKKSSLRKLFGKKDKKEGASEMPDQAGPTQPEIPGPAGKGDDLDELIKKIGLKPTKPSDISYESPARPEEQPLSGAVEKGLAAASTAGAGDTPPEEVKAQEEKPGVTEKDRYSREKDVGEEGRLYESGYSPTAVTPPNQEDFIVTEEEGGFTDESADTADSYSRPKFQPAKKTVWSEGIKEPEKAVVSIDQIDDFSGLILPKGATFEIDELKIRHRTNIFDMSEAGAAAGRKDSLWSDDISHAGIKGITLDAAGVEAAGTEKSGFLDKLNIFHVIRPEQAEYNRKIHGPIVDLAMKPLPGVEEIELYPVNEPYAYIRITYDHATHEYTYEVMEPVLSPAEEDLFKEIKERIFERLDVNTQDIIDEIAKQTLKNVTDEIIADYGIRLTPLQREKILYNMYKEFLGNGMVDAIMHDKYIEDISCDGVNSYLFVYHSRYESMRTNLLYKNAGDLDSFVTKLAQKSGKYISIAEPILDATMSDGSRIQMTLGHEVTAHGSTFTIRKFRDEPITPTDLIEWSTFSPLSIAFLWLAVEGGKSAIFAGGTASGKTTSLNAISLFIPPLAKIVTLEDTRELKLPHPNWIPSVTRASFDTGGKGEIDMYELLKAAMRQRPEYIIVGEVRGREALTLFQAMSTGHITYSTIHADSVASIVHRLENPPLNVPRNMLSALDLVSVQVQARVGGQRIRRNKQLIEILDIDPRTNELITNEVFKWHPATDEITYSGKSFILEEIMEEKGWDEARMREELKMRQEVLEWMRIKKLRKYRDVSNILIQYYRDPVQVMEKVRADLYE